ncbi:PAS and ANTAR domain-containing protein [Mycolicibacterium cosmeticum]|uniref:histidine kinase n=1 Tax=Mycolicibacterium cosmeticum TaxID=258533 RepID=W9BKI4_MYCCO|nr:PAS and ANTAR domain-containing protein [Mycolicibacterium cosmeticum]CDO07955.1 RNA-binding protein with PAS domain protein [Mycolicibacterium cosmeticum]
MVDDEPANRMPHAGSFRYLAASDTWEWSDELAVMHGYQPGTVTPTTELMLSHKHPDDRTTVAELLENVRRHGAAFSSRHRIVDTAGRTRLVVVVGDRIVGPDGTHAGTAGFYVDITDGFQADIQQEITAELAVITPRRAAINQAIGMVMLRYGLTPEQAFRVLTSLSQNANVKLRDLAERLVEQAAASATPLLTDSAATVFDEWLNTAGRPRRAGSTDEPAAQN